MKKLLFILLFCPLLTSAQPESASTTFLIRSNKDHPALTTIYSASNTLFEGENIVLLSGVDSSGVKNYSLKCINHTGVKIIKEDSIFFIEINFNNTDVNTNRAVKSLEFVLCKTLNGVPVKNDTTVFSMWYNTGQRLLVLLGKKNLYENNFRKLSTIGSVSKKRLLKYMHLSMKNPDSSNYCSNFKIAGFRLTLNNYSYYSHSDSITEEMESALKEYSADYVQLDSIYVKSPTRFIIPLHGEESSETIVDNPDSERIYYLFNFTLFRKYE